ncbi:MAG: MerR family transcriptional regulator [Bryobacterales bacterium]|nr:MerR family transcriptional regulator [Bryobacterales bacterium]
MHRRRGLERRTAYSSQEVSDLTGVTPRQLQWWDEQGVVTPRQEGHRRLYNSSELLHVSLIKELRGKKMALKKVRRILETLEEQHGKDYFSLHRRNGNLYLLTDGEAVYLEDSPERIIDIFSASAKGMFSVPVSKVIAKLELSEQTRKPVRSETARARHTSASKAS